MNTDPIIEKWSDLFNTYYVIPNFLRNLQQLILKKVHQSFNKYRAMMPYLIFGFALGTFICGLIEKFHKGKNETSWIKPSYLFALSGLGFLIFIYVAWPLLKEA